MSGILTKMGTATEPPTDLIPQFSTSEVTNERRSIVDDVSKILEVESKSPATLTPSDELLVDKVTQTSAVLQSSTQQTSGN